MGGGNWSESVELAVHRLTARTRSRNFTRQQLIESELPRIVLETGSRGATPAMTLSRELQQMRDRGEIEFLSSGLYRLNSDLPKLPAVTHCKCVFNTNGEHQEEADRYFRFEHVWLGQAARSIGQWVVYQRPTVDGPPEYFAIAQVELVVRDPYRDREYLALIVPGSFLEFGRRVSLISSDISQKNGFGMQDGNIDQMLVDSKIRPISNAEFKQITHAALAEEFESTGVVSSPETFFLKENQADWINQFERPMQLTSRTVRDRQFRKFILQAYEGRCAITGIRLVSNDGLIETQAAHIQSVEAGGPDRTGNGIALSGTIHWMFD